MENKDFMESAVPMQQNPSRGNEQKRNKNVDQQDANEYDCPLEKKPCFSYYDQNDGDGDVGGGYCLEIMDGSAGKRNRHFFDHQSNELKPYDGTATNTVKETDYQNQENQIASPRLNRSRGGSNHGKRDRNRGSRAGVGHGPNYVGDGGGVDGGDNGNKEARSDDFSIAQRLRSISGPTLDLEPIEIAEEKKFSSRNRLYIGNIPSNLTEKALKELFEPYGQIGDVYSQFEKNFTFLKVDYHINALKAKRSLDGTMYKGRQLRVRFAPHPTILRVSNLSPYVSNELLYKAFEIFGPLERAKVTVDDRGNHRGEGIVEFARKSSANACLRLCYEKCFFITASLRPCLVEPLEASDDSDGVPESSLKKLKEFVEERSIGPRFAEPGSFDNEYGCRWKQLHNIFRSEQDALKRVLKMEEEKLEAQMEYARFEHETELIRQELRKRESDIERKKMEWEMREQQAVDMCKRQEETIRRHQNDMLHLEEDMRRREQLKIQSNLLLDQLEGCGGNPNFDSFVGGIDSPFEVFGPKNSTAVGIPGPCIQNQDDFPFEGEANNMNQMGAGADGGGANMQRGNINNMQWERRRLM